MKTQKQKMGERLTAAEAEIMELGRSVVACTELEAKVKRLEAEVETLTAQRNSMQGSLDALRNFLGDMTIKQPVGRVYQLVKDLRAEIKRLRYERNDAESRAGSHQAKVERLKEELLRWQCVDTTKLKDITSLEDCKEHLQRERQRSHGLGQDIAASGYGKEVVLRRELDQHRREIERLTAIEEKVRAYIEILDEEHPRSEEWQRVAENDAEQALRDALEETP